MPGQRTDRGDLSLRQWPVRSARPGILAYFVTVEVLTAVLVLGALVRMPGDGRAWAVALLLAVIAVGFEEGATRAARLQIRLSSRLRCDMASVWAVAAAVALPAGPAVSLLAVVCLYSWLRQWRPAGEALYRKVFVAATILAGCLAAGSAARYVDGLDGTLPWHLDGAVAIVIAILVHTSVNRALVTIGLVALGARGRDLVGSRHDNLIELATLCLGGLVALAVLYEPFLAILVVAPMVTLQRGSLVRELEAAAMTDAKTGLLNAVAWEQLAQREIVRAVREKYGLGVLIIDIDRFKTVNDRFGHLVGDEVLRGIGKTIQAALREYDGLGRFGGEEFVAVLPDASDHDALVIAERVRARINQVSVGDLISRELAGADDGHLSVSIGVACLPVDGFDLPDLLHGADQALYRAKANGRNRVLLARRGGEMPDRVTV